MTAVPFLVLQRGRQVLGSISGSDAGKIRELVEKHAGKAGDINAGAAANGGTGSGSGGVGARGKVSLPPALEATPRPNGLDDADVTGGNEKSGTSSANGNIGGTIAPATSSTTTEDPAEELNNRLAELVKAAPVMLFMKGTPSAPQCGFSRTLVGLLREKGVRYGFFNILADEEVRQGLKVFSYVSSSFFLPLAPHLPPISFPFKNVKNKPQKNNIKLLIPSRTHADKLDNPGVKNQRNWPTFPQLYREGELVGGLDIVKEELENDAEFFAKYTVKSKQQQQQQQPAPSSQTVVSS